MSSIKPSDGEFKSIKLNYLFSTAYQVFNMIVPLITAPYISRVLNADGIGIYSYTNSICTYFVLFATLGTTSYGSREISRVRFDEKERSQLFWEIETLSLLTTLVSLAVWLILVAFSRQYRLYYIVLSMQIVANIFDVAWFFEGMEEFFYTVSGSFIVRLFGIIALFVFVNDSGDLFKYILILSIQALFSALTMWIYIPKFVKRVPIKGLKVKRHFKETLVYFIPTIAASIYTVLDKTLIGVISNEPSENGNYEQATKIINIAKTLTFASLNTIMRSRISYLFKEGMLDEIKKRINQSLDYILFFGVGICFGLEAISNELVPVFFGQGYDETVFLLRVLAPIVIIIGVGNCLGSHYYTPAGYRSKSAKYIICGSVVNLIMNIVLIPAYKSVGASIASVMAETTITLLYIVNSAGYFDWKIFGKQLWKKLISAIIMVAVVWSVKLLGIENLLYELFVEVFVGGCSYVVCLIILKDSFLYDYVLKMIGEKVKNVN